MGSPEERLKELGVALPGAPSPVANYVPAVRAGNLLFLSGTLPPSPTARSREASWATP